MKKLMKKLVSAVCGVVTDGRTIGLGLVGALAGTCVVQAGATAVIDLTTVGTDLLADVGTAATAGIGIFAAIFGIRVVIKAFSSAAA